jgi:hypothetical protein
VEAGLHRDFTGQPWQVAAANRTTILGTPFWVHWFHPLLAAPWGQVACWRSQSMVNAAAV